MKNNKIGSVIKTETTTEMNSVLCPAGNIVTEMGGYKNQGRIGNTIKLVKKNFREIRYYAKS